MIVNIIVAVIAFHVGFLAAAILASEGRADHIDELHSWDEQIKEKYIQRQEEELRRLGGELHKATIKLEQLTKQHYQAAKEVPEEWKES